MQTRVKKTYTQPERKESEERLRAFLESNMMGIAFSDLKDKILEANEAFLKIIGYTRKDLENGKVTWSAITPTRYEKLDEKKVRELKKIGTIAPFEKEYIHKKGHLVPVLVGAMYAKMDSVRSVSFAVDISEQKQLEKRKDEFIGTVSHELKTPLAVLKMQASLLREEVKGSGAGEMLQESVDELDQQIDQLTAIITHHLNLARLRDEHTAVRATLFDVEKTLHKVTSDFKMVTPRKIVFKKDDKECIIRGNEVSIAEVFTNLISNALRYSPEDTEVWVSVTKDWRHVRVCVEDFGHGIEKKELKKIFERYYRVGNEGKPILGSAGIGLHICNEIIKQHRGRIEVASTPGKGSTFCCVLPLASL